RVFVTPYANARQLIAWVLGLGENARIIGPPQLLAEMRGRIGLLVDRHRGDPQIADELPGAAEARTAEALERPAARRGDDDGDGRGDAAIRPERFARLVTLASILIEAGRGGRVLPETD